MNNKQYLTYATKIVEDAQKEGAILRLLGSVAFFIGPLLGGQVYEAWGANALWAGCLALGLLLALGYLALGIPAKRRMEKSLEAS